MHDFAGRRNPGGPGGYYRGTSEAFQSYGTYLAWHALCILGGQLLLERPVTKDAIYSEPWTEWVSKYGLTRADGLWLSDGTGQYPEPALLDLLDSADTKKPHPTGDPAVLLQLAGVDGPGQITRPLTVCGSWDSRDRVDVSIFSALVPPAEADLAAVAVLTSPPFQMSLPVLQGYEDEGGCRIGRDDMAPCEPWTALSETSLELDERDPYGSRTAQARNRPAKSMIKTFKLSTRDPWQEVWRTPSGVVAFKAAAWGERRGRGESEVSDQEMALYCEPDFLATVLRERKRDLLLLIKLRHYQKKDRYAPADDGDDGTDSEFTHSSVVARIDASLQVSLMHAPPEAFAAVEKLPEHSRYHFDERLRAIRKIQT
jgi:hypothetical protein